MRKFSPRRCALVAALWVAGSATFAETPVRSDLELKSRSRLIARRVRLEADKDRKQDRCESIRPVDLRVTLREPTRGPRPARPRPGEPPWRRKAIIPRSEIRIQPAESPLLHALVIDASASMVRRLGTAKEAARTYLQGVDFTRDEALVLSFHENVTLERGSTKDVAQLERAIDGIRLGKRTALIDGLTYAFRELDAHRSRPVLILLSDGADTASFFRLEDLLHSAGRRPDLIVFSIGLGLRGTSTVDLLTRLAEGTNGRYFQVDDVSELPDVYRRIEELLAAERILTVPDPDPMSRPPHVEIDSRIAGCRIVDLDRPDAPRFRPGTPHAPGRRRLSPAHRLLLARASEMQIEAACADTYDPAVSEAWTLGREGNVLSFCTPDIVRTPGLAYREDSRELIEDFRGVEVSIRRMRTTFPSIDGVVREPWELLERLAGQIPNVGMQGFRRSDRLIHGRAFLEVRGLLAAAAWEDPEWKAFARERLQREANEGLAGLRARYLRQFADAPPGAVETAVRYSAEGIELAHRVTAPEPVDLQPHLAAWLGDLPAHELFVDWERATWMRGGADPAFLDRWNAVRDLFRFPRHGRVVAALEPAYDAGCDCLGYWRLQLPRPGLMHPRRALGELGREDIPLDLIPERPLVWSLLAVLSQRDAAWAAALGEGAAIEASSYRLEGPAAGWVPGRAFRHVSLRVEFRDPAGRRFTLTARVRDRRLDPDEATSELPERPADWIAEELELEREGAAPVPSELSKTLPKRLELTIANE